MLFFGKNADVSKIKKALVLKGIISEIHICLYWRTKFQNRISQEYNIDFPWNEIFLYYAFRIYH